MVMLLSRQVLEATLENIMNDNDKPAGLSLAKDWSKLLNDLVPPKVVEVEDVTGATHRLRASLPAAVETRVVRKLEELSKLADFGGALQTVKDASDSSTQEAAAAGIDQLLHMLGNDELLDVATECFTAAHPMAVRKAIENARADEEMAQYLPEGEPSAKDVFSLADLAAGIVPFALLAGRKIGRTIQAFLPENQ